MSFLPQLLWPSALFGLHQLRPQRRFVMDGHAAAWLRSPGAHRVVVQQSQFDCSPMDAVPSALTEFVFDSPRGAGLVGPAGSNWSALTNLRGLPSTNFVTRFEHEIH